MEDSARNDERSSGPWYQNPWVLAAVVGVVALTALRPYCKRRFTKKAKPPPVLGTVPAFQLVDQNGKPFGSEQMKGSVWVVNFIFTSCRSICPLLTQQMKKLRARLDKAHVKVRSLSISVDPEVDRPPKLLAYTKEQQLDLKRWTFVTGSLADIRKLVEGGFRTHMGEKVADKGIVDIAHTGRFVLVDSELGIRGYYSSDEKGLDEIFHRSRTVVNEK